MKLLYLTHADIWDMFSVFYIFAFIFEIPSLIYTHFISHAFYYCEMFVILLDVMFQLLYSHH
jgi:hypothetical protein